MLSASGPRLNVCITHQIVSLTLCWLAISAQTRGWQTFSIKGEIVTIFSFASHITTISVTTFQLCHIQLLHEWAQLCSNKTLFIGGIEENIYGH